MYSRTGRKGLRLASDPPGGRTRPGDRHIPGLGPHLPATGTSDELIAIANTGPTTTGPDSGARS